MDDYIKQYKDLIQKKSKINAKNADFAVDLLNDIFKQTKDVKLICELVYEGTYIICSKFTEKYACKFTKKQFNDYCLGLTKIIKSSSKPNSTLPIGFSIVALKKEKCCLELMKYLVLIANKGGKFTDTNCKNLKKHLLDKDKGEIFEADFSDWSEDELNLFFEYINNTFDNIDELPYASKINKWVETYEIGDSDPKGKEIKRLNKIVKDLENRLEQVKVFDNTIQSQEIKKLKVDIAKSLKLEHEDFCDNINEPLSENNYDFFKATIKQVFKVLKRYGIKF